MKQSIFQQAASANSAAEPSPAAVNTPDNAHHTEKSDGNSVVAAPVRNPLLGTLPVGQSTNKEGEQNVLNKEVAAKTPSLPTSMIGASVIPHNTQAENSGGDANASVSPPPPPPPSDATPEVMMRFLCDKMKHAVDTHTHGKEVLAEVHQFLVAQPALKELLLPEDMASITSLMKRITATAHTSMTAAKVTATKKVAAKEEKAAAVDALFADMTI